MTIFKFKESQKEEAVKRLEDLTKTFNLSDTITKDFKNGEVKYTDTTTRKLCDVKDYPKLKRIIKEFEEDGNEMVYHVFVTKYRNMRAFIFLYVNCSPVYWESSRVFFDDRIKRYVIDDVFIYFLDTPQYSDNGYIYISSENGILTCKEEI